MVNSKAKGSAFERKVCNELSLWVSGGLKRDLFWRSSLSGGRATVARKRGSVLNRQAGDICAISPEGHDLTDRYYLDCKFYRDLQFDQFCLHGKGKLTGFWETVRNEAHSYNLKPFLIAKQNHLPVLALMEIGETMGNYPLVLLPRLECAVLLFDDILSTKYVRRGKIARIGHARAKVKGDSL